jgi:phosphoribosyl 1,2-cyclic phosphate phosphodiesterase
MIRVNERTYVFDTGPDFRQQMLREAPDNVDAVIFTHEHKDHIAGLDDIRPFNFRSGAALDIYATEAVQTALRREYHYVFSDYKYPGIPEINVHTIQPQKDFDIHGTVFTPVQVLHHKMPVLGFRIGDLAYLTDLNYIAPEEMEKLKGLDVLVLDALRKEKHISHLSLSEAIEMVEILKPKRAYFTHISHLLGAHEEVQRELPPNVYLAYDGLRVGI